MKKSRLFRGCKTQNHKRVRRIVGDANRALTLKRWMAKTYRRI